ncbi:amino acid adenylation domain-containing protein [Streptomyces albireticuli]|uniref:Thioester reductase n=1 Tax=Streptomyces albireticuli TaxID=1940 RepID=A0A2A2CY34_9ACTN|nr:amino acid adenylation domain-containing protein [Streptomyces albireticuli]MCD9140974.1 amino acid adenylation domain-containing protein [Streptomyces albireticuli]MCD9161064.1 amino acid adenylation domain-containing protein [Streptomyces albireticuli]MCD9190878.1 amino acid adenylation domain-containing protein [Streptomyces albireticuli]PAU44030.1 thioester reductase [Streptomyces albireticuli]
MTARDGQGRFSCFLVGGNAMVASCAELLLERGHRVLGVVSADPGVRDWASRAGLPALGFGPDLEDRLSAGPFDHLFSVANLRMLPRWVLDLPRGLAVNFHDGPLPRHAGMHATTWALLEGAAVHGVSWHVMTEEADAGDVLAHREVPVAPGETSATLNVACMEAGIDAFAGLADALASGEVRRRPQDLSRRTYHGRHDRPPGGGFLCWDRPAEELDAAVRARDFGPHANAFGTAKAVVGGAPVLVGGSAVLPVRSGSAPGTVLAVEGSGAVVVATAGRDLRLTRLTAPSGAPVSLALSPGDVLPVPDAALLEAAGRAEAASLRAEARLLRRLSFPAPADLPHRADGALVESEVPVPEGLRDPRRLLAALLAFLVRVGVTPGTDVRLRPPFPGTGHPVVDALYADWVPLRVPPLGGRPDGPEGHGPVPYDLWVRHPRLRAGARDLPVTLEIAEDGPLVPPPGTGLLIRLPARPGGPCRWLGPAGPLAGYAAAFLRALDRTPGADPARVPLGTEETRRATASWNATAAGLPLGTAVHRMVTRQARLRPDAPAVTCAGRTLGYGELDRLSSAFAGRLRGRGVGPGHRVGVYLDRSADLVVVLLGIMKSGAAYVPLDPLYPPTRVAAMVADAAPALLVTEERLAGALPATGAGVLVLDRERADAGADAPEDGAAVRPDTDAYVIFTSGSTGRPKGVRIGHRALANFVCAMARTPGFTTGDRLLAVTTLCFDIAGLELYVPLATGGQVEIAPADATADGFALRALLERSGPTVMQATPATWRMLLDAGWRGRPAAPLRMLCGGEALPPDLARELLALGGPLWNLYGPTETTIWSAAAEVLPGRPPLIGPPIANTRFHVLDGERRSLPPGVPGELYIGGDGVAAGYLDRPELTAERFVRVPDDPGTVYRTGDLVRQLPGGHLEFLGRADGQVKVRGYRVETGEVEAALRAHPAVSRAVVAVRDDRLVAYVVPRGVPATAGELRARLAAGLPGYMIPSVFVTLERIPLTDNGKTDRAALPAPAPPRPDPAAGSPDRSERLVAEVWREVLRLDGIGVEDNFFEVGGDSLLLMRVMARLRDHSPRPLTRVEMFMYPTVRSLARRLAPPDAPGPVPAGPEPPGPVRRGAGRPGLGELRRRRRG